MIRLVPVSLDLLDAALVGDDALAASPRPATWGARLLVAGEPPELVGWGGFKAPPDGGVVEIGYEVAESRRGRGPATAAARAMVAEAFADERVTRVVAHTLPERNASNRVLEEVGSRHDGDAREDGEPVRRYALDRPPAQDGRSTG